MFKPTVTVLIWLSLSLVAAPVLATGDGAGGTSVVGSGVSREEPRNISGYTSVVVQGSINVTLKAANDDKVVVQADDNIVPLIETRLEGTRLVIGFRPNVMLRTRTEPTVQVDFKRISGVQLMGSGNMRADRIATDVFEATVRGSGNLRVDQLDADVVALSLSGSGNVMTAGGKARALGINILGSGDVRSDKLDAREVAVRIRGSGDAYVQALDSLQADIAGSGDVRYRGEPRITVKRAGTGEVRKLR